MRAVFEVCATRIVSRFFNCLRHSPIVFFRLTLYVAGCTFFISRICQFAPRLLLQRNPLQNLFAPPAIKRTEFNWALLAFDAQRNALCAAVVFALLTSLLIWNRISIVCARLGLGPLLVAMQYKYLAMFNNKKFLVAQLLCTCVRVLN